MKENKPYYRINGRMCKRIIRALGDETLTVSEIMTNLLNQTQVKNGKPYLTNPTTRRVIGILSKYPIFERVGMTRAKNSGHSSMLVNTYRHIGE